MQPIESEAVQAALQPFEGKEVFIHVETTRGAYTEGGFGAFIRNARVPVRRALIKGSGPYRAGLKIEDGWIYAEGLTHWEAGTEGQLLLAGHDAEGRLSVALQLSLTPFRV